MATFDEPATARLRTALTRVVRELERRSTEAGISPSQLNVLGTVAHHKRIGLSALAEIEGINPTMLSRIVGKLEAAQLVRRVADDEDRRVFHAEITTAGARLWERTRRTRTRLLASLLDQLSAADRTALVKALPALETLGGVAKTLRGAPPEQPRRTPGTGR
jgi:DNA-binding MarR family transcriptional regulator